jgi:hypothetical protein
MKYQRLSSAELENLKDDFIRFIASQGIDAGAWTKMKSEDLDAAEEIIDIYSDLVYDQSLSKCVYLEHISAKEFKTIQFNDDEAIVQGIKVNANSNINLNTPEFKESVQKGLSSNEIEVFTATKKHETLRELEMFEWLKKGAYMADEKWFEEITRLINHFNQE